MRQRPRDHPCAPSCARRRLILAPRVALPPPVARATRRAGCAAGRAGGRWRCGWMRSHRIPAAPRAAGAVPLDGGYLSNSPFLLNVPHSSAGYNTIGLQCTVPAGFSATPQQIPGTTPPPLASPCCARLRRRSSRCVVRQPARPKTASERRGGAQGRCPFASLAQAGLSRSLLSAQTELSCLASLTRWTLFCRTKRRRTRCLASSRTFRPGSASR